MAENYREMMLERSPPFLATEGARPFMSGLGSAKDAQTYQLLEAVQARFPRLAPSDGLDMLGVERQMPRSPGEADAAYAERLIEAWSYWEDAGTARGLLNALWDAGYPNAQLAIYNGRRYYLTERNVMQSVVLLPGEWLHRDYRSGFWSEFIVLFTEPLIQRWVDELIPDETSEEAHRIRAIIRKWKPGHMTCSEIAVANSSRSLDYHAEGLTLDSTPGTLGDWPDWIHWYA